MREEPCNKAERFAWNACDAAAYVRENPEVFNAGFAEWLDKNLAVWLRFKMEADRIRRRREHYSARTILEFIRHETAVAEVDSEFKINNNATPDLARLYMLTTPGATAFFETRELAKAGD